MNFGLSSIRLQNWIKSIIEAVCPLQTFNSIFSLQSRQGKECWATCLELPTIELDEYEQIGASQSGDEVQSEEC